jgi:hypothetical protein
MLFLLLFSTTVGEGRLWERLGIYSGNLFIAIKFVGFIMKNSGKSRMVLRVIYIYIVELQRQRV